jgi:hypothetical protein
MFLRKVALILAVAILAASSVDAAQYIYKSKNKIDFIKIDKAKKNEKEGGLKHPYEFDPEQLRAILRSLHFNKKILLLKDIENRQLFDEGNVEFLAPYLIEAFKKAGPEEAVVVSYFTRDTKIVIQNDRLTIFRAFVKDDGLHFKFTKIYAKLLGDRTTKGVERMTQEARSLRVSLEVQPGQNRISWDPEELVFDLAHFAPGGMKPAPLASEKESKKKEKKEVKEQPVATTTEEGKSVRERLKELDQLKKDELITEKEYQKKRQELLKEL